MIDDSPRQAKSQSCACLAGLRAFCWRRMGEQNHSDMVEEATLAFSLGEVERAASMLERVVGEEPNLFEAWHALTEVRFSMQDLEGAVFAGEEALRLRADDLYANVSLSRVWAARGDKVRAEEYGAKARVMGWKAELAEPEDSSTSVG